MKKGCLFILLALLVLPAMAETVRYVSDKLEVPLRAGKSLQHKILRMMPVGTKVIVLATDNDGYSKVRVGNTEGWVLTRYLMNKPSAKTRLSKLEQQLAELEIEKTRLQEKLNNVNAVQKDKETRMAELEKENLRLQQENADIRDKAARTLAIADENQKLKAEILRLQRELETARQESVRLKDTASKDWFIYGAGVAVVCLFIGMLIPRMQSRRSSW